MNANQTETLTLLINLDRAEKRLKQMEQQLQKHGLDYQRIPAVDAGTLGDEVDEYDDRAYRILIGKQRNNNEIGCYLSHLKAWRRFLESDASHALILEDDACLPEGFKTLLHEAVKIGNDWDLLRLSSSRTGRYLPFKELAGGHRLMINTRVLKNTAGYVINRKAAESCIDHLVPMRRPIDVALDRDWSIGIRTACMVPFPITSGTMPSQIPKAPRRRFWRSTTFHLWHLIDHISRRLYRKSVHRRILRSR